MNGPEIVNLIADLIARLGFPIAVAGFLLWERRTTVRDHTKALHDLTEAIEVLTALISTNLHSRG